MTLLLKTAAAAMAALALAGCQRADDAAFGERVRSYLLEHPEVLEEASNALYAKKQAELAKASAAAIDKHRARLERDPRDLVVNPDGKVTVVEFFDYRCGYCKTVAPEVVELVRKDPEVRFVMKEWPMFGGISETAARVMLTPQARPKGLELHSRLMNERALTDATLDRHLQELGIDPAAARAAARDPAITRQLQDTDALRSALGIQGTPAFVVGDVMIPGADPEALKAAIVQAKAGGGLKRPGKPT